MCFQNCAKYLLVILQIAIFIAGAVLAITGVLLLFESGLLHEDVLTLFEEIKYGSVKFSLTLSVATYMMVIVGVGTMAAAVVGACGAWKKIKCCMLLFIMFVVIGILIQATLVGLWINLNGRSDEWLKGELKTLIADYKGPTDTDDISKGFNKLFIKARCCGIDSYTDMQNTPTDWYTTVGSLQAPTTEKIPATCCQGVETGGEIASKVESTCTTGPQDFYTDGCYEVIKDGVFLNLLVVCIVGAVGLILEVAAIVMSCVVLDQNKNRIRHATAGTAHAKPPPYIGIDAVLKNKGKR